MGNFVIRGLEMSATTIILIIAFAFLATFIQRVTGFGFGIVFMAVLPYLMPSYGEATALSGLLALICSLGAGIQVFRYLSWKKLIIILLSFILFSFFAVNAVAGLQNHILKKILGAVLILVSLYFIFFNGRFTLKPSVPVQISMGSISGIMGGLFGMQGPPAVIYFISCTDRKEEYMALTQFYFILGNIAMTAFRAGNGFVAADVGRCFLYGLPAVIAGLLTGAKVFSHMPTALIRKIVYIFIGVAGIVALISK